MAKYVQCTECGDFIDYDAGGAICVKRRGYSARYYCPRCIAKSNYESEEKQNEHIKSKEK